MPRKAATTAAADAAEAPRRSTRISSQPQATNAVKEKASAKSGTKRSAEGGNEKGDDKATSKKAKAADTEIEGENASDEPEKKALDPIDIGDFLPSLILKNEKDEDVNIAELASEKGVILFLVPKADTPGCTNQACGFRDIYPDFTSSNFDVYCLSADTPAAQSKWQTKKELPYPLLSDRKRELIAALGAAEGGKTKRSHFIFEKGGKLVDKKIPVKPVDSPRLALEFVKSL